jgi:hypothetical protein
MNRLYRSGPTTAENARRRWRKADGQILYRDHHHQHRHGGWYGRARHVFLILRECCPFFRRRCHVAQKVLPMTQSLFRILLDRHDDGLVMEATALHTRAMPDFGESFYPRRVFGVVVVPPEFMRRSSSPRFRVMSSWAEALSRPAFCNCRIELPNSAIWPRSSASLKTRSVSICRLVTAQ